MWNTHTYTDTYAQRILQEETDMPYLYTEDVLGAKTLMLYIALFYHETRKWTFWECLRH